MANIIELFPTVSEPIETPIWSSRYPMFPPCPVTIPVGQAETWVFLDNVLGWVIQAHWVDPDDRIVEVHIKSEKGGSRA